VELEGAMMGFHEEFRKKHNCDITCSTNWNELFQENYPNVKFIPLNWNGDFYAIYKLGCYDNKERSLFNYKNVSLSHISSSILGLDPVEIKPNIVVRDKNRRISNKYVCFTTESTAQAKLWNNPTGWQETINYLNSINLQPVLIQLGENNSFKNIRNLSGKKSIHDTINYLYNCEFFVGIGSGLSWLAWALNKPVVMISGFSNPQSEFFTPYRVINPNVCNSCWNEYPFDKGDWNWCPRQKGTERQFECSKLISSKMVIDKIDQICPK
jgi:autotransporter strand-loop-strand O-heptosyltransferase